MWYKAPCSVFVRRIVYEKKKNMNTMYAVIPLHRLVSSKNETPRNSYLRKECTHIILL